MVERDFYFKLMLTRLNKTPQQNKKKKQKQLYKQHKTLWQREQQSKKKMNYTNEQRNSSPHKGT